MNARDNQYLIVKSGVILTSIIEPVIVALDDYFEAANFTAIVTSGLRTAEDQLRIIRQYLKAKKLDVKYIEAMTCGVNDKLPDGNYKWQMGWSALLNAKIIINPPKSAILLMDYVGMTKKNRKGDVFPPTAHINGTCVDIGGGLDYNIANELVIINKALSEKKIGGMVSVVAERNNNCVHINCRKI